MAITLNQVSNEKLRADLARALKTYENVPDKGHGSEHIEQVVNMAQRLAASSGRKVNPDHLLAAGVLHDIAREHERVTGEDHALAGVRMAPEYLGGVNPAGQRAILHAIGEHRSTTGNPKTRLAKILADADRLPDIADRDIMFRRFVQYRRARGVSDAQIPSNSLEYMRNWYPRVSAEFNTPEAKKIVGESKDYWTGLMNDPVKWEEAFQPYLVEKTSAYELGCRIALEQCMAR